MNRQSYKKKQTQQSRVHTRKKTSQNHQLNVDMPVFHTGCMHTANNCSRTVPNAFKHQLLTRLLELRDATTPQATYMVTASGADAYTQKARADFAFQAASKLGLKVTPCSQLHTLSIEQHANKANREILIQFIHTPKCGGSYFKQELLRKMALPEPQKRRGIFPRCFHVYSSVYQCTFIFVNGHVPARNFTSNALRIGMIRRPFSRLQSAFYYLCHGAHETDSQGNQTVKYDWDAKWRNRLQKYPTLAAFLQDEKIVKRAQSINQGKEHFFPLSYWLCNMNDQPIVDMVIRQEHFTSDVEHLFATLGLDAPVQKKTRVNVSRRKAQTCTSAETTLFRKYYPNDDRIYNLLSNEKKHRQRWNKGKAKLMKYLEKLPPKTS